MIPRSTALLIVVLLLPSTFLAGDYARILTGSNAVALAWPAGATINYRLHVGITPSMANLQAGSAPVPAIDAGIASVAAQTGLNLVNAGTTTQSGALQDSLNVVTFANTPGNASLLNGGIGVTILYFNTSTGQIVEFDIIGTAATTQPLSTLGTAGFFDLQAVVAHECGHGVGLDHSPLFDATMHPTLFTGSIRGRTLATDDRSGLRAIYGSTTPAGSVTGTIQRAGGVAVLGAHVFLQDAITGRVGPGALTGAGGAYAINQVPPGLYRLLVEPLNGPMLPTNLIGTYWPTVTTDTTFRPAMLGGTANPTVLVVRAGTTTAVGPLAVVGPTPVRNIFQIFFNTTPTPAGAVSSLEATPPYTGFMGVFGTGVNVIADAGYQLFGPFLQITGPSTWSSSQPTFDDKILPITAPAATPPGAYVLTASDTATGELVVFGGCLEILPPAVPQAYTAPYGPSASGSAGALVLGASGAPSQGNATFALTLSGVAGGEIAYYLISVLPESVPLFPGYVLGVDLSSLLVPLFTLAVPTFGPTLSLPLPLPVNPALAGAEAYVQVLMSDSGSPFGAVLSNGLKIHIE